MVSLMQDIDLVDSIQHVIYGWTFTRVVDLDKGAVYLPPTGQNRTSGMRVYSMPP